MALADLFGGIADAIRAKDGTTAPITASTFPQRIRAIPTGFEISLAASRPEGAAVSGAGRADAGMAVTVTVVPDEENGYFFSKWEEAGQSVSTSESYSFQVERDLALTAVIDAPDFWFLAATLPSSAYWSSVAYGNGKFVTVTSNRSNKAAYSTDGINWTEATLPSSGYWGGVSYGNGKFVAISGVDVYSSTAAAYSTDGINWTAATLPSSARWGSTAYGNGKFVAVAYNSTAAAYSKERS